MFIDSPQPGWAEQNPEMWWRATLEALDQLPEEDRKKVQAIGISYQMHGLVLVDESLNPTRPSIIWCDGRATDYGTKIGASFDAHLNRPGNFTLAKLRWVVENEPDVARKSAKAMLPGDYLAARLTSRATTTNTGLSEMIAWNFAERRPSTEAWESAGGRPDQMPELVPIFGDQGCLSTEIAGIPAGIPVTYRAGDQPNNALSLNVFNPGELAAVAGTSGVLYGVTAAPKCDPRERVNPFLHVNDAEEHPRLGVLLCINGAGAFYAWLRQSLNLSFDELNALAAQSKPGANGVIAIPYGNGPERSLGNRNPGAGFHGIDVNRHGPADLARAALEGIAFAMRYGADVLGEMGMRTETIKAGDGSMFRSPFFRQIFADALGAKLEILDTNGALGAARAAGVGVGYWTLEDAFRGLRVIDRAQPNHSLESAYARWRETLTRLL